MPGIWTIGHSAHSLATFTALLRLNEIEMVCDVRSVPRSRRHPHFATEALAASLPKQKLGYVHMADLGGWRKVEPGSPNGAWTNRSFQGYADYTLSAQFQAAVEELHELADARRTAIMCAEALWWRCHRRLIADRFAVGGWEVSHIGADGEVSRHELPDFAVPQPDGTVLYPPRQLAL